MKATIAPKLNNAALIFLPSDCKYIPEKSNTTPTMYSFEKKLGFSIT